MYLIAQIPDKQQSPKNAKGYSHTKPTQLTCWLIVIKDHSNYTLSTRNAPKLLGVQASYVTALCQRETDAFIRLPLCLSPQGKKHRHSAEDEPWHALARSLVTELETITVYSYFAPRSEFCKNNIFFCWFFAFFFP